MIAYVKLIKLFSKSQPFLSVFIKSMTQNVILSFVKPSSEFQNSVSSLYVLRDIKLISGEYGSLKSGNFHYNFIKSELSDWLLAFSDWLMECLSEKATRLSLRGALLATKQSPVIPKGDCFGKKRLAMAGPGIFGQTLM